MNYISRSDGEQLKETQRYTPFLLELLGLDGDECGTVFLLCGL